MCNLNFLAAPNRSNESSIKISWGKAFRNLLFKLITLIVFLAPAHAQVIPNKLSPTTGPALKAGDFSFFNAATPKGNFQAKFYEACSIYLFVRSLTGIEITSLSTYKISSCPSKEFRQLTAASIKAQLRTVSSIAQVGVVGPHYQLMDENDSVVPDAYLNLGALRFSQQATSRTTIFDILFDSRTFFKWEHAQTYYNPVHTSQNARYTWYAGSKVHLLITDKNEVFVMVLWVPGDIGSDPEKNVETLNDLGNTLNLPAGWSYKTVTLNKVLRINRVATDGYKSVVMRDELDNTYFQLNDEVNRAVIDESIAGKQ
jgi:hypothetical protein